MIVRSARYLLTQLLFLAMGLPIRRYRTEVEWLWSLNEKARSEKLNQILAANHPLNSAGAKVKGLGDLQSSPSMSKKQLRAHPIGDQSKSGSSRFGRHTAGTTGEPTEVSLSRDELARMLAVRDYCFRHFGVKLGQREARLWGRSESGIRSGLKNFVMNRRVFHPVGPRAREEVVDMLEWQPDYLYGYASLLLEAAKILESLDLEFEPPKCVVCTAESVLPVQKAYLSRVFKAPVAEEYGSTEFDVIAFECADGHRHLVNPWLIVEEDEDNGLVSDVSRTTQNLIKYQLGDLFTIQDSACRLLGSVEFMERLQGRTLDRFFYVSEHEKVHASAFPQLFDRYLNETNDMFSFSLRQITYSELEVFVDRTPRHGTEDLKLYLERDISGIADSQVAVGVSVVTNTETSGKRNYFVQSMKVSE